MNILNVAGIILTSAQLWHGRVPPSKSFVFLLGTFAIAITSHEGL
jgi:hypothetical protein